MSPQIDQGLINRYESIPNEIDAVKVTKENYENVAEWCGGRTVYDPKSSDPTDVYLAVDVPTLSGVRRADIGEYVVREGNRFYPLSAEYFERKYRAIV